MENYRHLERFNLRAPAKVKPVDSGWKEKEDVFRFLTTNICAGGAFFHTSHTLPEGTEVDVEVVLPLDKLEILKDSSKKVHLKINGRVVRCEADGIAVCFGRDYKLFHQEYSD